MQVSVAVVVLMDHAGLIVPLSVFPQKRLQVPAVILLAEDQVRVLVR